MTGCLSFLHIMTVIGSLLRKWHNTVVPLTDEYVLQCDWVLINICYMHEQTFKLEAHPTV